MSALKLKRRPPFTTFAQRLMNTTFSVVSPRCADERSVCRSCRLPCPCCCAMKLKLQSAFACRVCESLHFALILKSAAVEDHLVDLLRFRAFRDRFADDFRRRAVRSAFRLA